MDSLYYLAAFVLIVLVLRLLGAWMLRINEIIRLQREILEEIRRLRE